MEISIAPIAKSVAKKMIIKHHYSHLWTKCSIALGVFKKEGDHAFFNSTNEKLIGCAVFGDPIGAPVVDSISPIVKQGGVWELTRLWVMDATPKNTESWIIARSIDYIENNFPKIKVIISYADPEFGHRGTIYQASNFIFQEVGITVKRWMLSYSDNPFKWNHPKTILDKYDCGGMRDLEKKIPKPYWLKITGRKFRYIKILGNKKQKREILKTLKHPPKPYPKSISDQDVPNEIRKIEL